MVGIFFKKPARTIKSGSIVFNSSNTLYGNWSLLKYEVSVFESLWLFKNCEFLLFEYTFVTEITSESLNLLIILTLILCLKNMKIALENFYMVLI